MTAPDADQPEEASAFTRLVRRRRMVRRYLPDPVDPAVIRRILDTARRGPSAGFSQPQRFVVVTDADARARIAAACDEPAHVARGLTPWLSVAPVHILPCVRRDAYVERYAQPDKRSSTGPEGWDVPFEWVDGGAALMLLLLAVADEGLAAGFLAVDVDRIREAVDLPGDWAPIGLVTVGMAAPDGRPGSQNRARLPLEAVVRHLG